MTEARDQIVARFQQDAVDFTTMMRDRRTPYPNPMILFYNPRAKSVGLMIKGLTLLQMLRTDGFVTMMTDLAPLGLGYWFHVSRPDRPPRVVADHRLYHTHLLFLLFTKFDPEVTASRLYAVTYSDPIPPSPDTVKWVDPHFSLTELTEADVPILEAYLVNPFLYYVTDQGA